ncbi:MAG TPA: MFS transporter [Nitrospiria bacterium]
MEIRTPNGRTFLLLCVLSTLAYFSYNLIRTPLLPLFADHLGASPEWIGFIVAASTLTGVLFKFPGGMFSDFLGRRFLIFLGVLAFSFAPFFYYWVSDVWQLILLRFFHGFATALFAPVAMTVVADMFKSTRGESLGWYSSANHLGKLTGPMVGGFLLTIGTFSTVFGVCSVIGVFIFALFFTIRFPKQRFLSVRRDGWKKLGPEWIKGLKELVSDIRILLTSSMEGMVMLASGALMAFLPIYSRDVGLNYGEIGLLFGIQGTAMLLVRPFMGRISDRYGRRGMIIGGLFLCALSIGLIPLNQGFIPLLLLAGIFGLGEAIATSSTSAFVADLCEVRSLGSAMGIFGSIMDIGHASGPLFFGLLVGWLGYLWTFQVFLFVLLAGVLLFAGVVRREAEVKGF